MSSSTIHLPHVPLPDVAHVDVSDVTDRAGDVWSTGLEKVQDLASAAIDRAGDIAAAAADRLEDIPDKAIALAGAAIPALRPAPKRSKKPFILIALVLVVVAGGFWFKRRRSSGAIAPYESPTAGTEASVSAAS